VNEYLEGVNMSFLKVKLSNCISIRLWF